MRRAHWLIVLFLAIPSAAVGQADSSDAQTLRSLLTEVRALHQDLLSSMASVQKGQILLSRLQAQQANVVRASDRLNTARGRLSDAQDHQKRTAADVKLFEDTMTCETDPARQKQLRDGLDGLKVGLEEWTAKEQRFQTEEIEAAQQLQSEEDKLNALETQLDDLTKRLGER